MLQYGLGYRAPPVTTLGATVLSVTDDFSDPSGWDTPTTEVGTMSYDDESLLIDLTSPVGHLWSWRDLSGEVAVVRVEGTVSLERTGAAGVMCGSDPDDAAFFVGVITSGGEWQILRYASEEATEIARGGLPAGVDPSRPTTVAVECAGLPEDGARIALFVDARFAGATSAIPSLAPFVLVGVYGTTSSGPFSAHIDDLRVVAGVEYAPVPAG
jgi:hypothetical protein